MKFLDDVCIVENIDLGAQNYLMTVKSDKILKGEINPKIGQFYMLKLDNEITLLRRPISIHDIDFRKGQIQFLYKLKGSGTEQLSRKKIGEMLNIQGPLGKGFCLEKEYKKVVVLGAGIGLAPLKYLIKNLSNTKIHFIAAARDKENLNMLSSFDLDNENIESHICTDDGSLGKKANAIELLEEVLKKEKIDVIFSCGPEIVLEKVGKLANKYGIEAQLSLEERMACGVGACVGCSQKTKNGMIKVCIQGPVVKSSEVF